MVSDGGSRRFLLVCFNAAVESLTVAIIMPVVAEVGMMILWGNQVKICPMQIELLVGI